MGSFNARLSGSGPVTGEAIGNAPILGGVLVVPSTTATTDPSLQGYSVSGDAAVNVMGVTAQDAVPVSVQATYENGNAPYDASYPFIDVSVPGPTSAIYNDVVGKLNYTTAAAYGDKLCSAAAGGVRKWLTATDDPAAIVGSCVQPGGVAAAGVALARIRTV